MSFPLKLCGNPVFSSFKTHKMHWCGCGWTHVVCVIMNKTHMSFFRKYLNFSLIAQTFRDVSRLKSMKRNDTWNKLRFQKKCLSNLCANYLKEANVATTEDLWVVYQWLLILAQTGGDGYLHVMMLVILIQKEWLRLSIADSKRYCFLSYPIKKRH